MSSCVCMQFVDALACVPAGCGVPRRGETAAEEEMEEICPIPLPVSTDIMRLCISVMHNSHQQDGIILILLT